MEYAVYTRDYDEVRRPSELTTPEELRSLMASWDTFVANTPEFFRYFHAPNFMYLDTPEAPVTLLLDASGSMKGRRQRQQLAAVLAFGDAMHAAGHPFRILGHTTRSFSGGRARERWEADGAPRQPGRLNDLLLIVFHAPEEDWEITRNGLFILLKDDLLKENIDGEALEWAAEQAQGGRIIYFTDGMCVDGSTLRHVKSDYLDAHRDAVVRGLRERGVELICISSIWSGIPQLTFEDQQAFYALFNFTFQVEDTEGADSIVDALSQAVSVKFPVPEEPLKAPGLFTQMFSDMRKHFTFS